MAGAREIGNIFVTIRQYKAYKYGTSGKDGFACVRLALLDAKAFQRNLETGDPDELAHPVVNSAPQRPRSPAVGGSTHVVIDKTW
jgi:hypothetical protein